MHVNVRVCCVMMKNVLLIGDSTMRYLYLSLFALLDPRGKSPDWSGCTTRCFWNERTYANWTEFYQLTSEHMFCDCFRAGHCCKHAFENRYAVVRNQTRMDYMQLFGDLELKGVWRSTGDRNELRRPHHKYAPTWSLPVTRLVETNRTYDIILWNIGYHKCGPVFMLDAVYAALLRVAPTVVFLTTIGISPCRLTPTAGNVLSTSALQFNKSHFWDATTHLHGEPNRRLASAVATWLNLSTQEFFVRF